MKSPSQISIKNRLVENHQKDDDSDEEGDEWKTRRYSLQLNSKGYRRTRANISTQPQLDSDDEVEQPVELLSRQNTM